MDRAVPTAGGQTIRDKAEMRPLAKILWTLNLLQQTYVGLYSLCLLILRGQLGSGVALFWKMWGTKQNFWLGVLIKWGVCPPTPKKWGSEHQPRPP